MIHYTDHTRPPQAAQHTHLATHAHGHYGDCTALTHVVCADEEGRPSQLGGSTGSTGSTASSAGEMVASGISPATTATPWRLVSGHSGGAVLVWDVSNEDLVLLACVLPAGRSQTSRGPAIQSLFISHDLDLMVTLLKDGQLAVGPAPCAAMLGHPSTCGQATHAGSSNGMPRAIASHAAAPSGSTNKPPAAGASTPALGPSPGLPAWHVRQHIVRAHRSGGAAMAVAGSVVVTASPAGGIKAWDLTDLKRQALAKGVAFPPLPRPACAPAAASACTGAGVQALAPAAPSPTTSVPSTSQPSGAAATKGVRALAAQYECALWAADGPVAPAGSADAGSGLVGTPAGRRQLLARQQMTELMDTLTSDEGVWHGGWLCRVLLASWHVARLILRRVKYRGGNSRGFPLCTTPDCHVAGCNFDVAGMHHEPPSLLAAVPPFLSGELF